jgi:EAL domain-containing protein (putative c-di-GMP-specific phosphodiesterase class I)
MHILAEEGLDATAAIFSGPGMLRRTPDDTLKIDMTFVKDLPNSANDAAIATSIVSLAQDLNLKVVGERVQTQLQHEYLRHLGCDLAQGVLYSRPVTAQAGRNL